jgi:signal transduction histidine kinase
MSTSKPSAGRGTGSRADPFASARLKLTLLYAAIITAIVVVLSSSLYEFHAHDVSSIEHARRIAGLPEEGQDATGYRGRGQDATGYRGREEERPGFGEYVERLGRTIIVADVITIVIGGALSWLLAAQTLRPIKESVEGEQRFFADAAHDLRTPLAVMRAEAEVALRSRDLGGDAARAVIQSSLEEIQRMSAMVEQMLSLARSGGARQAAGTAFRHLDLAELAREVTARMARRAEDRGLSIRVESAGQAIVSGDPLSLERCLSNVLENAVCYTPAGGSVSVSVERHGGRVLLRVADTGIGIPAEDLPHVAEPFYRGSSARSVHEGGAGLGLTIARAAMDEHRGTLGIESRPGEGTTISLSFPAA